MKLEISEKLYTEITKLTLTTYEGRAIQNEEGEVVILMPWKNIEPMLEDLVIEINNLEEKIEDIKTTILNPEN